MAGELSRKELQWLYHYNRDDGLFRHRVTDQVVGRLRKDGYRRISIHGVPYFAHRLALFYVNGAWPDGDVDHINGIRSDNRLENLRPATRSQNLHNPNRKKNSSNTSGFPGVRAHGKKWVASIKINYRPIHVGTYDTPEQAHAAYLEKKTELCSDI